MFENATQALDTELSVALPDIPSELISPSEMACILAFAKLLPPSNTVLFECRLSSVDSRADVSLGISAHDDTRAFFAQTSYLRDGDAAAGEAWQRLRRFCDRWSRQWDDSITSAWLEFDADRLAQQLPLPCIFFQPETRQGPWRAVTAEATQALLGGDAYASCAPTVSRCLDALPGQSHLKDVGFMLSRPGSPVRLVIMGIEASDVLPYLQCIDWPGDTAAVREAVTSVSDKVARLAVAIDVAGDHVLPSFGLECYFHDQRAALARLLECAVQQRWARSDKAAAVLRWPGVIRSDKDTRAWPPHRTAITAADSSLISVFRRVVSHVKVDFKPPAPVEAKVYFGLSHLWVRRPIVQ